MNLGSAISLGEGKLWIQTSCTPFKNWHSARDEKVGWLHTSKQNTIYLFLNLRTIPLWEFQMGYRWESNSFCSVCENNFLIITSRFFLSSTILEISFSVYHLSDHVETSVQTFFWRGSPGDQSFTLCSYNIWTEEITWDKHYTMKISDQNSANMCLVMDLLIPLPIRLYCPMLQAGLLDCIQCQNRADVCKTLLVCQPKCINV